MTLRLSQVSFAYGKHRALDGIDLAVQTGEFLGIMGPNSSGKSTLLKLIGRELQPFSGQIELLGRPLSTWRLDDLARKVTVVSSEESFSFPFTVEDIVLMGRIPYVPRGQHETKTDRAIVEEAMQATDVADLRQRSIFELSSGERQRVLLARALAQQPQVLILDEPTVHLDLGHTWGFFELLQRLHDERQLTIICALHDIALAEAFCTRLVLLKQGQLKAQGKPNDILNDTNLRDVFGVTRKETTVKKWITVGLFLLMQAWAIQPVQSAETEAATPVAVVTADDVGMTDSGKDVFVTLTRSAQPSEALPFNTQTIRPATFEKFDAQNAGDAISRLTGISIAPQGQLGTTRLAGIRGATSNQTLVLIDGRPMGGAGLSGSQDLAEIPTEQIDRIEVVRGGISALYGPNAVGGVINVITKRATYDGKPVSHVGYEAGSYDRQGYRLNFGSRWNRFDYFFFGDQQAQSGFRDNSDARTHNLGGNIGLSMGSAGKLLFDIANYHANAGIAGQLFTDIPTNQYDNAIEKAAGTPDARQVTDSTYIRTSYILPLPMNSLATIRAFGSEREVQFEIPSFFVKSDRYETSKGIESQVNLPLGFLAGGTFLHDRLDSRDLSTPTNNYVAHVENWGVFLEEDFHWERLTVIPSGRYDHSSIAGESKNPRVQLIADATDWLRFSGSVARSFRAPTIDDLFTPFTDFGGGFSYVGNPTLRPEKAWTYDAGFELHNDSSSFKVGYFRANVQDQIQTTSDFASTTVNVDSARRQGAEIEIRHVVCKTFKDSWNYTYLQNVGKPLGFTEFVPLRLSPRHTVNYMATVTPIRGFTVDNTVRYVSSRFEGNNETGTKLGDYVLWGLRVAYQLRQMQLYIGAEDLTNKRYEERGGYPLPGRTFYGGVTLKLWN